MADAYILLNRDEIAEPLARTLIFRYLRQYQPQWTHTDQYIDKCKKTLAKRGLLTVDFNMVNNYINQDVEKFNTDIKTFYKENYRRTVNWVAQNLDRFGFDPDHLAKLAKDNLRPSMVKSLGSLVCGRIGMPTSGSIDPASGNHSGTCCDQERDPQRRNTVTEDESGSAFLFCGQRIYQLP